MKEDKTKEQLLNELVELRRRVAELEASETKLRQAEDELSVAYDALYSTVGGVIITDLEGKIRYVNPAFLRMFEYEDRDEVVGKCAAELFPSERVQKFSDVQAVIDQVKGETEEFLACRKDGTIFPVEVSSSMVTDKEGNSVGRMASFVDITKRKRAEERIEHLSAVLRAIRSVNQLIIRERDRDRLLQGACDRLIETCGYDNAWIALMDETGALVTATGASSDKEFLPILERLKRGELPDCAQQALSQSEVVVTDGLSLPLTVDYGGGGVMTVRLEYGEKVYGLLSTSVSADFAMIEEEHALFREVAGDIAFALYSIELEEKRKRAEGELRASEQRYRLLFERNLAGVYRTTLDGRILDCNESYARIFGYDSREEILALRASEFYFDAADRGKFITQLQERGTLTNSEWCLRRKDDSPVWVLENSSLIEGEEGTPTYIQGTLVAITERKRAEEALRQSHTQLQRTLEGTVNVLVSAIEMRDPYTAGHQRRVTQLTCAIAEEMDLSQERIEGLRMAGLIHDIGKITVPAEILSKPSQLTELEFGLIKMHPQIGYDVLKEMDFPWPVAQIVLQHHERMDGSGYPQGLSGEDILLEARILGVADVVEAMASHRPYRPALGVDKALEEISQNRGVLYDPEVVDACLKLFTEKKYKFE